MKQKLGKRLLSGLISGAMTASCVLPQSVNVISKAADNDAQTLNENTQYQTDYVTLLVGKDNPIRGETVQETIRNAERQYALGLASQFAVFVSDDFSVENSDVEGRLACGGKLTGLDWTGEGAYYEVGGGSYNDDDPGDIDGHPGCFSYA